MSIKLTIIEQMEQIAREHGKIFAPLKEDLVLADCGLDSLGFAVLVARLEDRLGVDRSRPPRKRSFRSRSAIS
jgi:acyl carrier protein